MKSLQVGEIILEKFPVNCKYGKSILYISNVGIMIENSKGSVLDLDYESILSLQSVSEKNIRIIWREKDVLFEFIFQSNNPEILSTKCNNILKEPTTLHEAENNNVKEPALNAS